MANFEDVKRMVMELGFVLENVDEEEQLFTITDLDRGVNQLVVDCEGDIVILEQVVAPMPNRFLIMHCMNLLAMNRKFVHGAYTYNPDHNVVTWYDTLELANLDQNEIEGSLNALSLGLREHSELLLSMAQDQ